MMKPPFDLDSLLPLLRGNNQPVRHTTVTIGIVGKAKEKPVEKITRAAFIYLSGKDKQFAQCETCHFFNAEKGRCAILGPKFEVRAYATCCFYLKGSMPKGMKLEALVSPKNAGYEERQVRCENCRYSRSNDEGSICQLYEMLNEKFPDMFDLDEKIESRACCNANTPK